MSINTALEARRDALREREAGFTLIELLVVVIIIGILAAIAIPIYLGVTNGAKDSSTKSDLTNGKTAITGFAVDANGYIPASMTISATTSDASATSGATPAVTVASLKGYGWSQSANTTSLVYRPVNATTAAGRWCLEGTSATTQKFFISTNKPVTKGACPASTDDY